MPTATRFTRCLIATAASLLTLGLAGCGGSGNSGDAAQADMCAGTAPVTAVKGYPTYTPGQGIYADEDSPAYQAAICDMVAHYDAGYALVMAEDADPWTDGDKATRPVIETAASLESTDPQPGDEQQISQVASGTPVFARYQEGYREVYVMAVLPGGQGEPWECDEVAPASQEAAVQASCLATLRALDVQQQPSQRAKADATGAYGDATPDRTQWTLLGGKTRQFSYSWQDEFWRGSDFYFVNGKPVGNISTTFDVYRLNGVDPFDYFLVKAKWLMTPESLRPCGGAGCAFYNNEHRLGFVLQRKHEGAKPENGERMGYLPENVVRKQIYNTKIGGKLGFGSKLDGGLTAEVSTSYTYSAASISAKANADTSVLFKVSHATSLGTLGFGCDLCDADPTTVGTMDTTVWALYRFPRTVQDTQAGSEMIVSVTEQSGEMGASTFGGIIVAGLESKLAPYSIRDEKDRSRAYAISYALPYFSVKLVDADGKLTDPPRSAANPLKLKRGQVLKLRIETGGTIDSGTPITLGWQVISPPSFLNIANTSGATSATIEAVVRNNAPLGEVEYLKLNTMPRAAAPGMDGTDLVIPIQIVE
jgi:hypothetical protein